jgi:hypothetical protein
LTFHPKFTSYRSRLALLGIIFGVTGGMAMLSGHDYCHRGRDNLILGGILALGAAIPESQGKKPEPEQYPLTGGKL